jgi:hypothetical protein
MEITLSEINGHPVLAVTYDPQRLTWAEAIQAAIAAYQFDPAQVTGSARPVAGG